MAEHTMMVVTCRLCRGWYNMDFEYGLPDDHFDMRTGEPCSPGDENWYITEVPYREDWKFVN